MVVKNNPKYKPPYTDHETHLIYECEECKRKEKENNKNTSD
jgi:hypothetical protein